MRTPLLVAAFLAASPLFGQDPVRGADGHAPDGGVRQLAGNDLDWLQPVRAQGDPGELWASGPTYKVRFDGGMTFYPVLGASAPHNLPLGWRTESVVFEGQPVLATARTPGTPCHSDWRYEIVRPGVTEVYDVLAAGVEQSFVVADPGSVASGGDLVIRGRLDTPLHAAARAAAHAPLRFADDAGRDVLEYGAAFAIDARGRRLEITTALHDGAVELRVPAAWLRTASWPVIVDPLTSRTTLVVSSLGAASYPNVAHDLENHRYALTDSRPVSANDYDLILRLRQGVDWSHVATLFSDVTTANTRYATVSIGGSLTKRWVLAFERELALTSRIRVYFHDATNLSFLSGVTTEIFVPSGYQDSEPSIGANSGSNGFLVARRDIAPVPMNTEASYPVGFLVDINARTIGPARGLHTFPGSNYDAEHVRVSGAGDNSWIVVWQEYNFDNPSDDWDVIAQMIEYDGTPSGYLVLGESGANSLHKISPFADGWGNTWMVGYLTRANTGTKAVGPTGSTLRVQRFSWLGGFGSILGSSNIIDTTPGSNLAFGGTHRPLAYCTATNSHWGVAWRRGDSNELRAARIGYDNGVAEAVVLEPTPTSGQMLTPSMCWDWNSAGFAIVFASSGVSTSDPIYARRFLFDNRSQVTSYGAGCSGVVSGAAPAFDARPHAGTGHFKIELTGARPSAPTVMFAGYGAANLPLPSSVAGCRLLLDPSLPTVLVLQAVSKPNGSYDLTLPISSHIRGADLYWQFVQFDQGMLWSSNALRTRIY